MIFLFSDLDRTLIPNGSEPETPQARPTLSRLVETEQLRLCYVSGRDLDLVKQAINDYQLPEPEFVISDVGTTIYRLDGGEWSLDRPWHKVIGADWNGRDHGDIVELLEGAGEGSLQLQPDAQQNTFKVSYHTDFDVDSDQLTASIQEVLGDKGIRANLIWSRDEAEQRGLLDILPRRASKISAIRFLLEQESVPDSEAVFAGDSGNDLDALTSGLQAILVKNAADDVRREAAGRLAEKNSDSTLYLARGGILNLNGNYAAGVLEGLMHFFPELEPWLQNELGSKSD